jgi:hypothetical protein
MEMSAPYVKVQLFLIQLLKIVKPALQLNRTIDKLTNVNAQTTTSGMALLASLAIFQNTLILFESNVYPVLAGKYTIWK